MPPKGPSAKYLARARALAEAIDISLRIQVPTLAEERAKFDALSIDELYNKMFEYSRILSKGQSTPEEKLVHTLISYLWQKKTALEPKPAFANLRSLSYTENDIFTHWNESGGPDVERFWQLIKERGLPFERRDKIREILNRGRIRNDIEYDVVTDSIVILQQIGKISGEEAKKLSDMLGAFEKRARR
jgi:hypothetical protein